jgi:D-xylose transport system permease protein
MTQANAIQDAAPANQPSRRSIRSLLQALEVDNRLLGMIVALIVIGVGFDMISGGKFLTSRNLWNLSVQSSAVAIMATGMVLVIVSRNIDLSIGSTLVFCATIMGLLQAQWIPNDLGLGFDQPYTWVLAVIAGVVLGALIGGFQGVLVAYIGIPSFIVTLGGMLVWRGLAFQLTSAQTIAPLDSTFQLLGGGPKGAIGEGLSWAVAVVACVGLIYSLISGRRRRRRYHFPLRPIWADITLGVLGCAVALGAVWVANNYFWPPSLATEYAEQHGIVEPAGGLLIPTGIAIPVMIAIGATLVMTVMATRRRFGRYVFAIGGNPDAAELAGINTRWTIVKTFTIMGVLAAIAGAILSARLNAATLGLGSGSELQVIAAAVIGGTSFVGGIGTIAGAVLGAVVMQSLQSGMVLINVDSPLQDVVVGVVLVTAVGLDTVLRRRST